MGSVFCSAISIIIAACHPISPYALMIPVESPPSRSIKSLGAMIAKRKRDNIKSVVAVLSCGCPINSAYPPRHANHNATHRNMMSSSQSTGAVSATSCPMAYANVANAAMPIMDPPAIVSVFSRNARLDAMIATPANAGIIRGSTAMMYWYIICLMGSITFFGGAGSVTGSKHLVEVAGKRILLDCGTFQGLPDVRERNRAFSFPPESIDAVVLSHAHLDHCGMLPLLVKRGFKGNIFATGATKDVAARMLEDMAGIEMQDAEYRMAHHIGSPDDRIPLITLEDLPEVMNRFVAVPYARDSDTWHEIIPGVHIKLYDAGHILGSAVIVLQYEENGKM